MIPTYLIHYTPLKERLVHMQDVLFKLDLISNTCVIHCFDAPDLSIDLQNSLELWSSRIPSIAPILLANVLCPTGVNYDTVLDYSSKLRDYPSWMSPRPLNNGEISVLLKHFTALSHVAHGTEPFGLILEDDIFLNSSSYSSLYSCLASLSEYNPDYLDLAGGAGLTVPGSPGDVLSPVNPSRTRTNAAYVVSASFAKKICNSFFPLCFPIDWHLQYIMSHNYPASSCFWASNNPLIHGSMHNLVKSWRD